MKKQLCCADCGSTRLKPVAKTVPVVVQLFGHPYVRGRGPLTKRHALAIVVYLATTQRWVPRDTLAAFLWPDFEKEKAEHNLRQALYLVARCVGPALLKREGAVSLDMSAVAIVREDKSAPFLEGFQVRGASTDWDHWVERVRGPQ